MSPIWWAKWNKGMPCISEKKRSVKRKEGKINLEAEPNKINYLPFPLPLLLSATGFVPAAPKLAPCITP
jgi:hypothetical protein